MKVYELNVNPLVVGHVYQGSGRNLMRYLGPVDPSKPVICTPTMLVNTSWHVFEPMWKVGGPDADRR